MNLQSNILILALKKYPLKILLLCILFIYIGPTYSQSFAKYAHLKSILVYSKKGHAEQKEITYELEGRVPNDSVFIIDSISGSLIPDSPSCVFPLTLSGNYYIDNMKSGQKFYVLKPGCIYQFISLEGFYCRVIKLSKKYYDDHNIIIKVADFLSIYGSD